MSEAHDGVVGGHYAGKAAMHKILKEFLWWPTIHMNTKILCRHYDTCQRIGKPSRRDDMPLVP